MADNSRIDYVDATINPLGWGCYGPHGTAEKPNRCPWCFAHRLAKRHLRNCPDCCAFVPHWHPEELDKLGKWKRPRRIFIESMGDLFGASVPDWQRFAVWWMLARSCHTGLILTKEAGNMAAWFKRLADTGPAGVPPILSRDGQTYPFTSLHDVTDEQVEQVLGSARAKMFYAMVDSWGEPPAGLARPTYDWAEGPRWWPTVLPNVWLGTSVTNQADADERIPLLLKVPAAVRWLSCEPLLGPITFRPIAETPEQKYLLTVNGGGARPMMLNGIHWVVVGQQTGPGAVKPNPAWVQLIVNQCAAAGVACFVKGRLAERWPVREFPRG